MIRGQPTVGIRFGRDEDAPGVLSIYIPIVEATAISFELVPPTTAEIAARIVGRQPAHPFLVAEAVGEILGYAYAGRFAGRAAYDWSVETSVYVAEQARGRGLGAALYSSLLALLTAQGYRRAMAGIALPNAASVTLHERAGFALVGVYPKVGWKLGQWRDVGWWQRPLGEDNAPARDIVPLSELPSALLEAALGGGT
jgi:phosphinothricin acetyltransferase